MTNIEKEIETRKTELNEAIARKAELDKEKEAKRLASPATKQDIEDIKAIHRDYIKALEHQIEMATKRLESDIKAIKNNAKMKMFNGIATLVLIAVFVIDIIVTIVK